MHHTCMWFVRRTQCACPLYVSAALVIVKSHKAISLVTLNTSETHFLESSERVWRQKLSCWMIVFFTDRLVADEHTIYAVSARGSVIDTCATFENINVNHIFTVPIHDDHIFASWWIYLEFLGTRKAEIPALHGLPFSLPVVMMCPGSALMMRWRNAFPSAS